MRLFLGGTSGFVQYEDGEISKLSTEPVLCMAKPNPSRILAGTETGRILVWEGNGDARIAAKDLGDSVNCLGVSANGSVFAGSMPASAWLSKDGGETWKELSAFTEAPNHEAWNAPWGVPVASAIATHPKDPKTIFFGVEVGGVYRTRDAGKKWFDLEIPTADVHNLQVSPAKHDRVYVTTGDGAFCSDDEGFTWRRMGPQNVRQYTMGLAAHPTEADRVIISAASSNPGNWGGKSGAGCDVYLSTDAGRRFRTVAKNLKGGVQRGALVINPKVPSEIVFGTSTGDLHYSNDGGESFDKVATKLGDLKALVFA